MRAGELAAYADALEAKVRPWATRGHGLEPWS
jgi:hypothetical protein